MLLSKRNFTFPASPLSLRRLLVRMLDTLLAGPLALMVACRPSKAGGGVRGSEGRGPVLSKQSNCCVTLDRCRASLGLIFSTSSPGKPQVNLLRSQL